MKRLATTILCLAAVLSVAFAASGPLMNKERMLIVDGKPSFILGLYEDPADDAVLKEAADSGFNLIQVYPNEAALDRMQKFGLKAWINLGSYLDLSSDTEARKQKLTDIVGECKGHPALLIWEGPDEALWSVWYTPLNYMNKTEYPQLTQLVQDAGNIPELTKMLADYKDLMKRALWEDFDENRAELWSKLGKTPPNPEVKLADMQGKAREVGKGVSKGIDLVRKMDPDHVIWLNHAPRNSVKSLRFYGKKADMIGCDIYPVPDEHNPRHSDLSNIMRSSVGEYTLRMREASPDKACAMVLQGFGWRAFNPKLGPGQPIDKGEGRVPLYRETRFMAYDSIIHGANAIMYWGTAYIDKDSQLWKDIMATGRELRALEPALIAPSVNPSPRITVEEVQGSVDGKGVFITLRKVGRDYVLIVVNENSCGVPFTISRLPKEIEGKKLYRLGTDESVTVKDCSFSDGIIEYDAHVYSTSRRFEP